MYKSLTLQLDEDVYKIFSEAAKAENRTLENLIETAALLKICEQQFSDDAETHEILADKELMKRIQTGSHHASLKKGRFVE
ncbi:Uncharacterized protein dnl_33650 [Desulfonema limicola]|uniref:CopG family transcriptional regulator n=1 Tax=Desulfonema limicola TaxID=45656 RepID=A0A975GH46_9BACT|nr:hypothetical protein [Desulfonema limicola]QTA81041.1 Uncharacterized protein dnl_33650 [Desulfonema limicola]